MNFNKFVLQNASKAYSRITRFVQNLSVVAVRNNSLSLVTSFKYLSVLMGIRMNQSWIRVICYYLIFVTKFYKKSNMKQLCLYLKTCYIMVQQAIANNVQSNLTPFGVRPSRTNYGLPRIIPVLHRQRIMNGETIVIQFWLTLFSLYRVLVFPGKINLSTITNPGVEFNLREFIQYVPKFIKILGQIMNKNLLINWINKLAFEPYLIFKSGAQLINNQVDRFISGGLLGIIYSFKVISESSLYQKYNEWLSITNKSTMPSSALSAIGNLFEILKRIFNGKPLPKLGSLGRLGFKDEAAGKVRVFAIVDWVLQCMFRPLHGLIFKVLRNIPQDGTFNQELPIKRLLKNNRYRGLYSFDLSSATDRLPISIQELILQSLIGVKLASLWVSLLVDREYVYNNPKYNISGSCKYTVGQPMGALSSWAMLALTHHFLVQYSAYLAYKKLSWFRLYGVLGDDLVIGDRKVAIQYLLLCKRIGLGINLTKSIQCKKGHLLEFAKRTFYKGIDCSPLTLKEYWMAYLNLPSLVQLVQSYIDTTNPVPFLTVMGFGYKAKSRCLSKFHYLYKSGHKRLADRLFLYRYFIQGGPFFYYESVCTNHQTLNSHTWTVESGYINKAEHNLMEILYSKLIDYIWAVDDLLSTSNYGERLLELMFLSEVNNPKEKDLILSLIREETFFKTEYLMVPVKRQLKSDVEKAIKLSTELERGVSFYRYLEMKNEFDSFRKLDNLYKEKDPFLREQIGSVLRLFQIAQRGETD